MRLTVSTPTHGVLWERESDNGHFVIAKEDRALLQFLADAHTDVNVLVSDLDRYEEKEERS